MSMSGTDMAGAIVDALVLANKFDGLSPAQIATVKADMSIAYNAMVTYITANMEISGIQVSEPLETVETYAAGVGNNGGSMVAGLNPVVGSVIQAAKTRTQSNDGTGRVS